MKMRISRTPLLVCVAAGLSLFASLAQAGAPAGRYTIDSANGTVFDNETGLMWQRDVPASSYSWLGALSYCEGLGLAGYSGWRLPNQKELHTLVDVSTHNPAIDTAAFPSTPASLFWSSSPAASRPDRAWAVYFYYGWADDGATTSSFRVRCVR